MPSAALSLVHPVVFGVVVAAAVGIITYQLLKPKKEKIAYTSADSTGHHASNYYYDPGTKSVTSSAPVSNTSENNLRKRQVAVDSSSVTEKNNSEVPSVKKTVSTSVQTAPADHNQNIDDNKVLPEKNLSIPMSVTEKVDEYFLRNIYETDSTDSNLSKKSKKKKIANVKQVHCCDNCKCESRSDEDTLSFISDSSSWSDMSLDMSTDDSKRAYVEEMCIVLNKDLNDIEAVASGSRSVRSVRSIESESSIGTFLSGDSELCRGCEQNPVNTYTEPCNHRYMCSDCAMKIFRLFKRCKVCRAKIVRIVVAE